MPFCPKCKAEYREGFKTCHDCHMELVDELPGKKEYCDAHGEIQWQRLMNVMNSVEADSVAALLEKSAIPTLKKHSMGGYYMYLYCGMSNIGVNIYVPKEQYPEAIALMKAQPEDESLAETATRETPGAQLYLSEEEYKKSRILYLCLLFFLFGGPGIVTGLRRLIKLIKHLIAA